MIVKLLQNENFEDVFPVITDRICLIRCKDTEYNLKVDLSFSDCRSVYKSYLIKYWLTFDAHLKSAMLVLKSWAARLKLTDKNEFSVHALTMMFAYFMQNQNITKAPTFQTLIHKLQINGNWKKIRKALLDRDDHVLSILYGFWKFYKTFDYKRYVIYPLNGGEK